jgi:rhamnogalacturonan endolyase
MVLRYAHGKTDTRRIMVKMNDDLIGSLTFAPTADWDTWDSVMVSVNLKAGLNILYLKSLEENGAPNLDQLGFDVPGVSLYESASQLSEIDTLQESTDVKDSSGITALHPGNFSAEDDFAGNLRLASGVYMNLNDNTIIAHYGGNLEVGFFDMMGHQVARFAKNIPAGSSDLSEQVKVLPKGIYMVQVKFNGKKLRKATRIKIDK